MQTIHTVTGCQCPAANWHCQLSTPKKWNKNDIHRSCTRPFSTERIIYVATIQKENWYIAMPDYNCLTIAGLILR